MRLRPVIRQVIALLVASTGLCGITHAAKRTGVALQAQETGDAENNGTNFVEADAARVFDGLRQALESDSERRLLKLFDAARMPDYPALRNQVAQFFEEYEAFQVRYHITQVSTQGRMGVAMADFELEATPSRGASPNVRRKVQLRLVLAWDGKRWKIVDLAPRELFS
jgi:hypothetical protein